MRIPTTDSRLRLSPTRYKARGNPRRHLVGATCTGTYPFANHAMNPI